MIDYFLIFPVETRGKMRFGNRHTHRIGQSLTQRAGCNFDTGHMFVFRMPRRAASPLPESFNIVERQIVTGQMQKSV